LDNVSLNHVLQIQKRQAFIKTPNDVYIANSLWVYAPLIKVAMIVLRITTSNNIKLTNPGNS